MTDTRAPAGRLNAHLGIVAATLLAAAAPVLASEAPKDPLEKLNRATYAFNDALDRMIAKPAAKAYRATVPAPLRTGVSNFVSNLAYPTVFINDALQGKLHDAGSDALRFLVNTTLGIAGIADPATHFGLPIHDEDFGQTLGHWGVHPGPYFVLPVLGPSDFRDAPGKLVDHFTNAEYWGTKRLTNHRTLIEYGLTGLGLLDRRTALLATDETREQAFDEYVLVRNAYMARRDYLVRDGNIPEETYDDDPPPAPKRP